MQSVQERPIIHKKCGNALQRIELANGKKGFACQSCHAIGTYSELNQTRTDDQTIRYFNQNYQSGGCPFYRYDSESDFGTRIWGKAKKVLQEEADKERGESF